MLLYKLQPMIMFSPTLPTPAPGPLTFLPIRSLPQNILLMKFVTTKSMQMLLYTSRTSSPAKSCSYK